MAATAPLRGAGHHGEPHLAHHFENSAQQLQSAKLGMWIFLATELLFFGGLFCAYAVYRANHPEIFLYAHQFLDKKLGGINTIVLICSSFTMAWAVRAAQLRQTRILKVMLALTILCAFGFLGIKYVEYHTKWEHGLLWARQYHPHLEAEAGHAAAAPGVAAAEGPAAVATSDASAPTAAGSAANTPVKDATTVAPAPEGPAGLAAPAAGQPAHAMAAPKNVQTFFSIYFLLTGLHGIHVLAGILVIGWLLLRSLRGEFADGYFTPVDLVGLYWHLVDIIWIFLFPLLYLIH